MQTNRNFGLEKQYLLSLIGFAAICILRFFDLTISIHTYQLSKIITIIYFFLFFVMSFFLYKKSKANSTTKQILYLIMFAAIFLFPMFLYKDYFGSSDVYAWIICFSCIILILTDAFLWLIPIGVFAMTWVSPMSICSITLLIVALLVNRYSNTSNIKYFLYGILGFIFAIMGLILNIHNGVFTAYVKTNLILVKFIITIILILPYIIFGALFFKNVYDNESKEKREFIIFSFLAGCLAPITYTILGDYSRAFFYGFIYYILLVLINIAMDNKSYIEAFQKTKNIISNYVAFPGILIAYPFIIMTIWISGSLELLVEVFVG